MHLDPLLTVATAVAFAIVIIGIFLRRIGQPVVITYLIVGVALGPSGLSLISDADSMARLGAIGVVFLLFFVGMDLAPARLIESWRVAIFGTGLQILASVALVYAVGAVLDWPLSRILLIGFVVSLSSTALVLRLLDQYGERNTAVGQNATVILLTQDLAIIPMLLILSFFGGEPAGAMTMVLQLCGAGFLLGIIFILSRREEVRLPFSDWVAQDPELQVFAALGLCFGLAMMTGLLQLSTALGAFAGGMVVAVARETQWVRRSIGPFEIVFVAVFLISVGMIVDLAFVRDEFLPLCALVLAILLTNTGVNAAALRLLGSSWREAFYAGALLSQIGEFSFVIALVGYHAGIIGEFAYQFTVALIALSLLASPAWIALVRRGTGHAVPGPSQSNSATPSAGSDEIRSGIEAVAKPE